MLHSALPEVPESVERVAAGVLLAAMLVDIVA